jgi:hypothetical protein
MKLLTLSFITPLLFFINVSAQFNQNLILGEWTKVKTEMLDGSRDVDETYNMEIHRNFKITADQLCVGYEDIFKSYHCYNYTLVYNNLYIIENVGYEIDKVSNDSLVLIDRLSKGITDDKVKVLTFIRTNKLKSYYQSLHKNDSIVVASKYFTPEARDAIHYHFYRFNRSSSKKRPSFFLIGYIEVFPKLKKVNFKIKNEKESAVFENYFKDELKKINTSFKYWNLSGFENFSEIRIPLIINFDNSGNYERIYYFFFKERVSEIEFFRYEDRMESQELFKQGLFDYSTRKYDAAIEKFKKSYLKNKANVDAIYNLAGIYMELNDAENACKMLKILVNLGQNPGIKLYNENCVNEANKD